MRCYVIVDPGHGVYLGCAMGLGFFSLDDSVGQEEACTFESADQAADHVRGWDCNNDPVQYKFVGLECAADHYATIEELEVAGLGDQLGDMRENRAKNRELREVMI